jgi:SpoVK/Ycf46/Vps4 family AAA+-type ATPase
MVLLLVSALYSQGCGELESQWQQSLLVSISLGRPLLVVNVAELVSKWVGETGKNIQTIFADAKKKDAVLAFDEAEGLVTIQ